MMKRLQALRLYDDNQWCIAEWIIDGMRFGARTGRRNKRRLLETIQRTVRVYTG